MKTLNDDEQPRPPQEDRAPQVIALLEQLQGRLRVSKEELVTEVEAHLTDLLGVDLREAMRAVADHQTIKIGDSPNFDRCHKSGLVLLSHVLYQARVKRESEDADGNGQVSA